MMRLNDVLESIITEYSIGLWIFIGTVFGMMAALAKSLNGGTVPDARWWLVRILLAGFFALAAGWAAELFHLSSVGVAFLTSTLNLLGMAAVEIIERRAKKMFEQKEAE